MSLQRRVLPPNAEHNPDPESQRRARRYVEICQGKQIQPNSQLLKLFLSGLFDSRPLTCYTQFAKFNFLGERGSVAFLEICLEEKLLSKASAIDFSGQGLRDSAIPILVDVLRACPRLTSVNLSNNVISTKSGMLLFAWLNGRPEVNSFDLSETRIDVGLRWKFDQLMDERGGVPMIARAGMKQEEAAAAAFLRKSLSALHHPTTLAAQTQDRNSIHGRIVTMMTHYHVNKGRMKEFQREVSKMTADARADSRCLFYDWMVSDNGQTAGCRQGCLDTMSLMDRLKTEDQGALLSRSVMTSMHFHGPAESLKVLRSALTDAHLPVVPEFYVIIT